MYKSECEHGSHTRTDIQIISYKYLLDPASGHKSNKLETQSLNSYKTAITQTARSRTRTLCNISSRSDSKRVQIAKRYNKISYVSRPER